MSRSTVATKDPCDLSRARFQAELLRVIDARSNKIAQHARSFMISASQRGCQLRWNQAPSNDDPSAMTYELRSSIKGTSTRFFQSFAEA